MYVAPAEFKLVETILYCLFFQRSGGGAPDQPIDYNDLLNQKRREENLYR